MNKFGLFVHCVILLLISTTAMGADQPNPRSPWQQELEVHLPELSAALEAAGKPPTRLEAQTLGSQLAEAGYRRLDDTGLKDLLVIRIVLATIADEAFCAAMWGGAYSQDKAPVAILSLPEDQQRQFARIMIAAQVAEARNEPPVRRAPDETELTAALERFYGGLSAEDQNAFANAIAAPQGLTPKAQCRATRLFYRRLSKLALPDALVIVRSTLYD